MDLLNLMRASFPKSIDTSKPVFSALIANENSDAALQKQLLDLFAYMEEWTSTPDIYEQSGDLLIKTVTFFSYLEMFADETEKSLKNRFKAIFVRNHDKKWGTPTDIKNVFKQYFPHATVYLVENTNKIDATAGLGNLFLDGDINSYSPEGWSLTNCSVTSDARFSGKYGVTLSAANSDLSQSVNVSSASPYFLHFFLYGNVNVQIKDNNNKYWDFTSKTWKDAPINNYFETTDWNNETLYFITTGTASSVTVSFLYGGAESYIDYFRLFAKQPYGSFTVLVHFEGNTAVGAFGLAAGDSDPNIETTSPTPPQPRYSNYGYYNQAYLSGLAAGFAKDIYEDLLDYLRPQGVKGYLDILLRDI